MPKRIQRRRTKGWRMPENAVYVGRPTKWGNPWKKEDGARDYAIRMFRARLFNYPDLMESVRRELRGKDLVCWCPLDGPCHADVLLEVANAVQD